MIVRATQGNGQMPDGTSRFKCKGQDIKHFVRVSLYLGSFFLPGPSTIESKREGREGKRIRGEEERRRQRGRES